MNFLTELAIEISQQATDAGYTVVTWVPNNKILLVKLSPAFVEDYGKFYVTVNLDNIQRIPQKPISEYAAELIEHCNQYVGLFQLDDVDLPA